MPLKSLLDLPDHDEPLIEGEDNDDDKVLVGAAEGGRAGPGVGGRRIPTLMAEAVCVEIGIREP
jgi:hypothetical protein